MQLSTIRYTVERYISTVSDSWKVELEDAFLRHELFSHKLWNNEAESPLNDADFVRLSTSLSLLVADAAATVCRRRRHGSHREDLTTTSRRCLVAVLGQRRHHGAITDETTTISRRCLVVVSTVSASLPLATLYCWLLCYY